MKHILLALLLGTTLYSQSTIVNGELVLENKCQSTIDRGLSIFRQNNGTDYSILAKGEYALRVIGFASCYDADGKWEQRSAISTIEMAMAQVYRDRQEPIQRKH